MNRQLLPFYSTSRSPQLEDGLRQRSQGRLLKTYLIDLSLVGVLMSAALVLQLVPPFERPVYLDDRSIQNPYKATDIIPGAWLPMLVAVIPSLVIILVASKTHRHLSKEERRLKTIISIVGLGLAISSTFLFTNIAKNMIGRLRPDYLARCNPEPQVPMQADMVLHCRGPWRKVQDGRRSFPSGHAATSFAGYGFLGLWLAGQLCLFDGNGYVWRWLVVQIPYTIATAISLSRIIDWRHHLTDVIAGAVLGLLVAQLAYRLYFPSVMQKEDAWIPYLDRLDNNSI